MVFSDLLDVYRQTHANANTDFWSTVADRKALRGPAMPEGPFGRDLSATQAHHGQTENVRVQNSKARMIPGKILLQPTRVIFDGLASMMSN